MHPLTCLSKTCKCFQCGEKKTVSDLSQYVYKRNNHFFCSWHCLRAYDKEHPRKYKRHRVGI